MKTDLKRPTFSFDIIARHTRYDGLGFGIDGPRHTRRARIESMPIVANSYERFHQVNAVLKQDADRVMGDLDRATARLLASQKNNG